MTNNQEDYIKIICEMKEKKLPVTNKAIAQWLKIKPSSVTEMLKKLEAKEYLSIDENKIKLTEKGEKIGKNLLTKHRLWETFLIKHLGYNWTEVHEEAEILEHVTSNNLKDKLNEFLNYPIYCPHGNYIYENYDKDTDWITLSHLKVGDCGTIKSVIDEKDLLIHLDKKGVGINKEFKIAKKDDFDESLIILLDNNKVILSKKVTDKIFVEIDKNGSL